MTISPSSQIKWKLTLVILGTSLVILSLGAVAVWIYDTMTARANLLSHVNTMAEITGANCSAALGFGNERDAQETLDSLRVRAEIDLACLYTGDGKLFAYFGKNGMTPGSVPKLSGPSEEVFDHQRLFVKRQVLFREDFAGSIVIGANLKQQSERSRTFLFIAVLVIVGLAGVALLLATRLQRLVSDPIARLATAANHITKHRDYSVRVPNPSADEIGSLVVAFNQMLSEIERQNAELVESERRLKLALSASQMGVWEWNLESNRVTWSEENARFFGDGKEEVDFERFTRLIHPADANSVATVLRQAARNPSLTPFAAEYRTFLQDGKVVWVAHHGQVRLDSGGKPVAIAGIVQDVSKRKQADADHQALIAKLLHAEEDERRRIARELHDTTAQHLAVLKISISQLSGDEFAPQVTKILVECDQLLETALQEIRTLTYVLHPPALEEFGLIGVLKDFAAGVSRRSGVQVTVHNEEYRGRLPRNVELTLFRVVQESVTNAVRHSGAREVSIRLARDSQEVRVEIQDSGRGLNGPIEAQRSSGVGIASMEERMALIGGIFNIESDAEGVTILASLPIADECFLDEAAGKS